VASDNFARSSTDTALGAASSITYNSQSNGTQLTSVAGITVTATTNNIDDITSFTLPDGTVVTDVNQVAAFKMLPKKALILPSVVIAHLLDSPISLLVS
jgi:hypothetical protein